jgi:hypothetical protein
MWSQIFSGLELRRTIEELRPCVMVMGHWCAVAQDLGKDQGSRVAKETITRLIDDLDGGEAAETVLFGLDGHSYEIDLSAKNAAKLRNAMAAFVENGSRTSGRVASLGRAARGRSTAAAEREQNQAIRAWAMRKGIDVAPRGRIKAEVVEQYQRSAGR